MNKKLLFFVFVIFGIVLVPHYSHAAILFDTRADVPTSTSPVELMTGAALQAGTIEIGNALSSYASGNVVYDTILTCNTLSGSRHFGFGNGTTWGSYNWTGSSGIAGCPNPQLITVSFTLQASITSGELGYLVSDAWGGSGSDGMDVYENTSTSEIWNCMDTNGTDCLAPVIPPATSSTISFISPTSTTYYYNPLPYVYTQVTGISSSSFYNDTVTICDPAYNQCESQPLTYFSGRHQDVNGNYVQQWPNFSESVDLGLASSTVVDLHAILEDGTGNVLDETTLDFHQLALTTGNINPNGTSTVISISPIYDSSGTYTGNTTSSLWTGQVIPPLDASTTPSVYGWCTDPDTGWDVGENIVYAGCSLANWLFNPSVAGNNVLATAFTNFENTPPFSYVYVIFTSVSSAGVNLQSQSSTELDFTMPHVGVGSIVPTTTIEILGANTVSMAFTGSSGFGGQALLFDTEDYVMLLLLVWFIFRTITQAKQPTHPPSK